MQVFEYSAGYGKVFCMLLAGLMSGALLFTACEDPGSLGSGFINEEADIQVDTVEVSGITGHAYNAYSGNYAYLSVGEFNDPLFGTVRSIGYIKPSLPEQTSGNPLLSPDRMILDLHVDQSQMYGDTTATADFDLVEVGELWRGGAHRLNEQLALEQDVVGSFSIGSEDSVLVDLSDEWIDKFRDFYLENDSRDSLYRYGFYGLAVVPRGDGKVVPVDPDSSQFYVFNADDDTLEVDLSTWGYSLQRDGEPASASGESRIYGTLERVMSFDLRVLQDAVGSLNISRVELVIYEDSLQMESSLDAVSPAAVRPEMPVLRLHRVEQGTEPESIDPGNAIANGFYEEEDQAFHFDITTFVRGGGLRASEGFEFYVTGPPHNGVIRSSLVFNENASSGKTPKLIVTSIQTAEN